MPYGKIEEFDCSTRNWDAYIRRVKQYILLNEIKEELHVAILVTHVGAATYDLMCDLCAPDTPEKKTFDELVKVVSDHLEPKRSDIAERHVFRQKKQLPGESLNNYLQALKHLATTCKFEKMLEENLRDQFVSGLHSEVMRSRLFAEKDLDYKKAVELALALEAADRHAEVAGGVHGSQVTMNTHKVAAAELVAAELHQMRLRKSSGYGIGGGGRGARNGAPGAGRRSCKRCGKNTHDSDKCRFKNYTCDNCGIKGHLKAVCKRQGSGGGKERYESVKHNNNFVVDDESSDSQKSESELYNLNISCLGDDPYRVNLNVANVHLPFEADTGSRLSVISKQCYDKYFRNISIQPVNLTLRSYTGDAIESAGFIRVTVEVGGLKCQNLKLYVVNNGGPPLLGRSWLRKLKINLKSACYQLKETDFVASQLGKQYPEVFSTSLGSYINKLRLHLVDDTPVYCKARGMPLALREPVRLELERLEREGIIYKVERSDYGTPIVPIVKKNGSIRICGDYKVTINPKLKDYKYPLPRIEELFAALGGGQQFTKLDLSNAYQQILLDDESQAMTAITTHVGTFAYRRVPFGLKCIPENFQKIMEEVLHGLDSVVVFLDDICVTGKTRNEHITNLRAVLDRLKQFGLTVNESKCEFFKDSVTYVGYKIDRNGLHMDESKVKAISGAPRPSNVSELKGFLGLVNFYAKFCPNISDILKSLYLLLKKETRWHWSNECESAFKKIKEVLLSDLVLAHYEPELPLILAVDSSPYGVGAILSHRYPNGDERPISCASRTLNETETRYSQIDKEALAIVFGVRKHHQYLYGRRFLLRSDHRALSYIFAENKGIPQTAASRLQRYAVILAAYDFEIQYVSSAQNGNADALSRLPLPHSHTHNHDDDENCSYVHFVEDSFPLSHREIKQETIKDPVLSKIYGYVMFGWPEMTEIETEKPYFYRKDNLHAEHGCLVWGYRIVVPSACRGAVLREIHSGHQGMVKMKQIARSYVYWPNIDADIEGTARACEACRAELAQPPHSPLQPWAWPDRPWARLHVDYLGPYRNNYYLLVMDAHSKWIEVEKVPSTSASAAINFFYTLFSRWGLPQQIVSDNGPPFTSTEIARFMSKNGIKHILVAPYHPSSNGAGENSIKQVKKALKKATTEKEDANKALCEFLFSYRNTAHSTTQVEPAVAMLGRRLRGRLDLLRPNTGDLVHAAQQKQRERHGGVPRQHNSGDPVLVRDYRSKDSKWKEAVIEEKTGPVSYRAQVGDAGSWKRHADQIIALSKSLPTTSSISRDPGPSTNGDGAIVQAELGSPHKCSPHTVQIRDLEGRQSNSPSRLSSCVSPTQRSPPAPVLGEERVRLDAAGTGIGVTPARSEYVRPKCKLKPVNYKI